MVMVLRAPAFALSGDCQVVEQRRIHCAQELGKPPSPKDRNLPNRDLDLSYEDFMASAPGQFAATPSRKTTLRFDQIGRASSIDSPGWLHRALDTAPRNDPSLQRSLESRTTLRREDSTGGSALNSFLNMWRTHHQSGIRSASLQIRNHFRDHPANRLWRFDHGRSAPLRLRHDDTFSCFSSSD